MNFLLIAPIVLRRFLFVVGMLATVCIADANNNMREWKLASGDKYQAELVSYDEAKKSIILRQVNQKELHLDYDALSAFDRAWLLEWVEFGEEMQAMLEKLGGKLTRHTSTGKYATEYSVYQPNIKNPVAGTKPPMLILFHPSGNGHREIMRYLEAADAVGLSLVSCEYFRNGPPITATQRVPELENDLLARFNELLPHIEANVTHDEKRMFRGGCSGGAWRSFHYAAQVDRKWAGVYSNCGWLGGKIWYDLPYPKMRVALVDGNQDPAGGHRDRDIERLNQAGCKVTIHAFEGGHQVPPPSVQQKAFRWLLSDE
jgi:predicted esterase